LYSEPDTTVGCALDLSYHQIYRLLNGYKNSLATYAGILEKCPAMNFIAATVTDGDARSQGDSPAAGTVLQI